jgi:carnitine-CoA ligase
VDFDRERVIPNLLRDRARHMPTRKLVKCDEGHWLTFGDVDEVSDRVAAGLAAMGISKGDRVGVLSANREEVIILFFAIGKIGAINVSYNTFLKGSFLAHQIKDAGPSLIVADGPGVSALAMITNMVSLPRLVSLDADPSIEARPYSQLLAGSDPPEVELTHRDLMGILYTSGTTGPAKGCMLSHGYYTNIPIQYLASKRLIAGDRIFTSFPFFHTAGQAIMMMSALVGPVELALQSSFHASTFIETAAAEDASVLWGVGAMAHAILAQPPSNLDATRRFRLAQFQPLGADQQEEFERRFSTPVLAEGYGQTECTPIAGSRLTDPRRRTSLGRPVDYLDVRLVDGMDQPVPTGEVGEVVVRPRRPEVMFQGYWNRNDATVAAFRNLWHHTGDYARQDAEGFLYFVDRRQDVIRRRGENISSYEVELAIGRHPGIAEVAVHAVSSDFGEDEIKAVIVPSGGAEINPGDLFEFFKNSLPYFAIPRYVQLCDGLPRNSLSKVLKHELRTRGITNDTWDLVALNLQVARGERR